MATRDSTIHLKRCSNKVNCTHPESKDGWLPATSEYFNRNRSTCDGLRYDCKVCSRQANQQYRDNNAEKERTRNKVYYAEHKEKKLEYNRRYHAANSEKIRETKRRWEREHQEKRREQNRRWRHNNPEKVKVRKQREYKKHSDYIKQKVKRWAAKHPERVKERTRAWYEKHPEQNRIKNNKRRALLFAAKGAHTPSEITAQYKRQKGRCYYAACGHCKLGNKYHVEHVVPLSRGGRNDLSNLVLTCPKCNISKHNKLPHEWLAGGRLL